MKVSVVIPAYNAADGLAECLRRLAAQRLEGGATCEIVVVDDGSTDNTSEIVRGHEVKYVFKPRNHRSGRAAARNSGIAQATGELIVMIDPDHVFGPDLIAEHLRYHRNRPDLVMLGPRIRAGDRPDDDPRAIILSLTSDNLNNLQTCWHYLFTCNVSVRREHLVAVGGFDEAFTGWGLEDSELGYRLRRRGLAFAFNPDAVIHSAERLTYTKAKYAQWRRNLARFVAKHPKPEVALQWHLDETFDPERSDIDWVPHYVRFEYAARALADRLPGRQRYTVIDVDETNAAEVTQALPRLAADTVILDRTTGRDLRAAVQCTDTPHELLYYQRRRDDDLGEWAWHR